MKLYQNWKGARADKDNNTLTDFFPVQVPGNIQYDYGAYAQFGDLHYGDTVTRFKETESWFWKYRADINVEPKQGERVWFVAEGIDYISTIFLNGKKLVTHEGQFTPVELDITNLLAPQNNCIEILIHPHPKRPGAIPYDRQEADQSCKPPYCYGWAWNPRLLTSGLWCQAYVETRDQNFIRRCEPSYELTEQLDCAHVTFDIDCDAPCRITLCDEDGNCVYSGTDAEFDVQQPQLWWCNGEGHPYLYTWKVENDSETRTGHIGFKTLKMVLNTGARNEPAAFPKSRYPAPVQIVLNGRKIFAQGSNWVNPELFYGRVTAERYEELVLLAADAHMNIFRIWGGSGFCHESFYDACDKHGILVWQEFMLACNCYGDSPHYLKVLEQEATSAIKRLRSHVSLAFWCGGNELFNGWSGMTEQSLPLRLLDKLCYELDPKRPYLMTSPLNGMAHGGYLFYSESKQDGEALKLFAESHYTAYTEFACPSLHSLEQIKKVIPEENLKEIKRDNVWPLHNAYGGWGVPLFMDDDVRRKYRLFPETLEETVKATQWLQKEGLKLLYEEMRRQEPYCSMALNWCFNEPWRNVAGFSLLEYPATPKPAYFSVKDALRPVMASAFPKRFSWKSGEMFTPELWYLNHSNEAVSDTIRAYLVIDGQETFLLEWQVRDLAPKSNRRGPTLCAYLPACDVDTFTLRLDSEKGNGSTYSLRYISSKPTTSRLLNL